MRLMEISTADILLERCSRVCHRMYVLSFQETILLYTSQSRQSCSVPQRPVECYLASGLYTVFYNIIYFGNQLTVN